MNDGSDRIGSVSSSSSPAGWFHSLLRFDNKIRSDSRYGLCSLLSGVCLSVYLSLCASSSFVSAASSSLGFFSRSSDRFHWTEPTDTPFFFLSAVSHAPTRFGKASTGTVHRTDATAGAHRAQRIPSSLKFSAICRFARELKEGGKESIDRSIDRSIDPFIHPSVSGGGPSGHRRSGRDTGIVLVCLSVDRVTRKMRTARTMLFAPVRRRRTKKKYNIGKGFL